MASRAENIAQAIKTRLDTLTLSASFTSEVDFDARDTSQTSATANVKIVPVAGQEWTRESRGSPKSKTVDLVLSIKQKAASDSDISGFMLLAEEILDDISEQKFDSFRWQSLDFDEAFSLEEYHATGVLSLTVAAQFKGVI